MSRTRSLLVLGLCCLVAGSTAAQSTPAATVSGAPPSSSVLDPIDTSGVLDLRSASITQSTSQVVWRFATRGAFLVSGLAARKPRTVCLQIGPRGLPAKAVRLCLTGRRGTQALYRSPVVPGGPPARFVTAWVSRPDLKTAAVGFAYTGAAVVPGSVSWSASTVWLGGSGCTLIHLCHDRAPDTGTVPGRIDHYRFSGCAAAGPSVRFSGPIAGRMIALTFDDGPTTYTTRILAVLNSHRVHATFFDIGRQVAAGASAERAVLASGDMLGNHTWSHPLLTARNVRTQLITTQAAIRSATSFTPCLMRPPYGSAPSSVVSDARSLGLLTIQWDVDPRDWARPGVPAIVSRVLAHAHAGAIVLLHAGGGDRSQTVAALRVIVPTLLARGYRLVTLTRMLGLAPRYVYAP